MAFQYPEQPWVDGQETERVTLSDGSVAFAIYEKGKNLWKHYRLNADKNAFTVDSCEVFVDHEKCACEITPEVEYKKLQWQQNINDYFEFWIHAEDKGLLDRVIKLEATTEDLQEQIDNLRELLFAVEGVGDLQELIDELESIKDFLRTLDARDINQAPLPFMDDAAVIAAIPPGVAPNTQQYTNYYLADAIQRNEEYLLWFGSEAPTDPFYKFWWDTERLDLTIQWNGQWWPVSVPPEQIEAVAASLAALQRDTMLNEQRIAQLRRDISAGDFRPGLQQVLDVNSIATSGAEFGGKVKVSPGSSGNEAVTYQQLQNVESSIPSSDEFYLKTGGDLNGYVYSKGDNSGYYLGAADGSLIANFREKLPLESTLELRGRTTFKLNGYAPGDNQAFAYVNLDTNEVNGLQIQRLADPVSSHDAAHKNYVDSQIGSAPANGAAQFKWTVDTNKPESAVPAELHASLIGGSKMNELTKIRFSDTSKNGHKLSFPHATEPIYGSGAFLTAWYYNIDTKQWTWRGSSKVSNLQYTNNYIEATLQNPVGPQNFSNGSNYYFTIGGFF